MSANVSSDSMDKKLETKSSTQLVIQKSPVYSHLQKLNVEYADKLFESMKTRFARFLKHNAVEIQFGTNPLRFVLTFDEWQLIRNKMYYDRFAQYYATFGIHRFDTVLDRVLRIISLHLYWTPVFSFGPMAPQLSAYDQV